jgi:hypothetical protein
LSVAIGFAPPMSASVCFSSASKSSEYTAFAKTGPAVMPIVVRKASAVSRVSETGISSGSVTRWTQVRFGSRSISTSQSDCRLTGPSRTASARPIGADRNVSMWPAAGASTMIVSKFDGPRPCMRPCSRYQIFPSMRMSFSPGAAAVM